MKIINIESKEIIAELPLNTKGREVKIQPKYLMKADLFNFENALYHTTQLTENVNDQLSKLHSAEKFDYLLIFPDDFDDANKLDKQKGFTAYLLWKDGKYKTLREDCLKEFNRSVPIRLNSLNHMENSEYFVQKMRISEATELL